MGVKIGHAIYSENGTIDGKTGDQTGKEICTRDWYRSGEVNGNGVTWDYLLVCTDEVLAKKAAEILKEICENNNYGYSQVRRWQGYQSIAKLGIKHGKGDFDCSSLALTAYILAGLDIEPDGYTGNMRAKLLATGKFKEYSGKKYVATSDYAKIGALYLREGHHVAMALEDGEETKKQQAKPGKKYFPKYVGKSVSIVDALNAVGADSSFAFRKKIAVANGVKLYVGTAKQNTGLLDKLKAGTLIKP